MRTLVKRDYATFSGKMLERYFYAQAAETGKYTIIGQWWDRKGENEIDMIAANEIEKTAEIFEIKRHRKNINISELDKKVNVMLPQIPALKGCSVTTKGLDLDDM